MYPERGMLSYKRRTRLVADKSNSGNAGNGTSAKIRSCRDGADPPKKEQGIGLLMEIDGWTHKCVSAGKGCCISDTNVSHSKLDLLSKRIPDTRRLSPSAAAVLSLPSFVEQSKAYMYIGNSGQISSIAFTDLWEGLRRSRRFR